MEERYAGILAALNAGMGAGRNARIEGDSGEVSVSGELALARASSPTLPPYSFPGADTDNDTDNDGPHVFPLSPPPPPSAYAAPPPPSAYIPHASTGARRRSSPGPDASAWFGGYSVAPAPSAASAYSHSSTHFLTRTETGTRTRTGSEEPLLTRAGSGSSFLDYGNLDYGNNHNNLDYGNHNNVRLGSAFGSPEGSMTGHGHASGLTPTPTSPSSGMLTRSATASSFDVLRSISSQGALRSTDSCGYGFGFGSASSGTGSYRGPGLGLAIGGAGGFGGEGATGGFKSEATTGFKSDSHGTAPTSFKSGRWKKGKRESVGSSSTASVSASVSGSGDERHAGVRAFFGRLRRGNTPSPRAGSEGLPRDVESEGCDEKSTSVQVFSAFVSPATPEPAPLAPLLSPRFILSNPDPRTRSPYIANPDPRPRSPYIVAEHEEGLRPWLTVDLASGSGSAPAPVFGETADGLLDPRLRDPVEGRSNSSLRDFEDYSRPIGGLINNRDRMHSTTTFGTIETHDFDDHRDREREEDGCAGTPRASWIIDGGAQMQ